MPRVLNLVPDANGGIGRLFSYIGEIAKEAPVFEISTFATHGPWLRSAARLPGRLSRFAALCRDGGVDLVHINLASRGSTYRKLLYAGICRHYGVPYIVHLHGGGFRTFYASAGPRLAGWIDDLFGGAALVLATGEIWRTWLIATFALAPERVAVLANGVPGPAVVDDARRETPPRILFLGLLHPDKGIMELIDALSSPEMRRAPWTATVAGGGAVSDIRALVASRGLGDRVSVPGWASADTVRDLLERASILALPSHVENLPLSLLEGMAYGLCPVTTPVGSIREVIEDGANGLIVPAKEVPALTAALHRAVTDHALRDRLGRAARQSYEAHFTLATMRGRLDALYARALARPVGAQTERAEPIKMRRA